MKTTLKPPMIHALAWILLLIAAAGLPALGTGQTQLSPPQFQGGNVSFNWNSGGELQVAPAPGGPWTTVQAPQQSASAATVPFTPGSLFFRVLDRGIPSAVQSIASVNAQAPFTLLRATIRKAATSRGNALIEMTLTPGQNPPSTFTLLEDGETVTFNDLGQDGDAKAGDGVFTGPITVDDGDFSAANDFVLGLPASFQVVGHFEGRDLVGSRTPTLFDVVSFEQGLPVQIVPSPFDGHGLPLPGGPGPGARRRTGGPAPKDLTLTNVFVTNIIAVTNITFTNVLIGGGQPIFITNIDCKADGGPGTNRFLTNINCQTIVIGTNFSTTTNIVCQPTPVGFTFGFLTNVLCTNALVAVAPDGGLVCFTNVVPNPDAFLTNLVCTNLFVGDPATNQPVLVCFAAAFKREGAPEFLTNVICQSLPDGGGVSIPVCITNVVEDPNPTPIFADVCFTNVVQGRPQPIFTNFCTTNITVIDPPPGDGGLVCVTNVVMLPPTNVFTNVMLTNIVVVTNVFQTNIVVFLGDTNIVDTSPTNLLNRPDFWPKSLMVTDLSVVEDPSRTWDPCHPDSGTKMGPWTFGRLMTDVCNPLVTGIDPGEFARRWVRSWMTDQVINFDTVTNRNAEILTQVLDDWETASGGPDKPLDLSIAPFRLLAIVNRVDLRGNPGYGGIVNDDPCNPACVGGEARFVFCVVAPGGGSVGGGYGGGGSTNAGACGDLPFTVIFEYCVPKNTCAEIRDWGLQWYNLARLDFGPAYNTALQAITDQFALAGADPRRKLNLSALSQLRANEQLREPWELREWRLFPNDSDSGWLREVTVKQTPDFDLNFQPVIRDYCLANAAAILTGTHSVPLMFQSPGRRMSPFLGGCGPMPAASFFWDGVQPTGSIPGELRHMFSLATCNGCHSGETGTPFTHVFPRASGQPAALSDFLTGLNMPKLDPADQITPRYYADLKRREDDLLKLVSTPCFFQLFQAPTTLVH